MKKVQEKKKEEASAGSVKPVVALLGDGTGEEEDEEARKAKRAARFGDGAAILAKAKAREAELAALAGGGGQENPFAGPAGGGGGGVGDDAAVVLVGGPKKALARPRKVATLAPTRSQPARIAKPSLVGREFEGEAASGEIRISAFASQILTNRRRNGDIVGSCEEMEQEESVAKKLAENLSHKGYERDYDGNPRIPWHITENKRTWKPEKNIDCRSLAALMKTMRYILVKLVDSDTEGFEGRTDFTTEPCKCAETNYMCMFTFVDGRYRQIRRELVVQGCLETPESVKAHEQIVRFRILSSYVLSYKFPDPSSTLKLREVHKEIQKCFITLFACYDDPNFPVEAKRAEAEMKAYFILLKAFELQKEGRKDSLAEISKAMRNVSKEVRSHPLISLAWEAFEALGGIWSETNKQLNYVKFFRMIQDPAVPFLFTAMLHCNVELVRVDAGKSICRNSGGDRLVQRPVPVPVAKLERTLCFEDTQECLDWLDYHSLEVRTREEHREALTREMGKKEAAGQLTGMSGKVGIEKPRINP